MAWAGRTALPTAAPRIIDSPRVQSLLYGRPAFWNARLSWAMLIVTISVLILVGSDHSVISAYRDAAHQWFAGRDIYNNTGHGFLYLPSAAILFAPFAALPNAASEIAWRFLTIGSFAVATWKFAKFAARTVDVDLFPLMTLAALPPALSCARNGQSTLVMTALMMLATVDLAGDEGGAPRRWRATLWLSLSLAFKPLSVAMILIVAALDRRMAWRLLVGVGLVLLFPFLTQAPHYVAAQYSMSLQMFRASSLCGMTDLWAQPFSMLTLVGVNVSESAQTAIRVAAGAVTLVLCWLAQRRHDRARASEFLFSFSVIYILLFNPRSENNTYAMLGPAIGLYVAPWMRSRQHRAAVIFLSLLLLVLAAGDEVVRAVTPPGEHIWLKPSLGILFFLFLVRRLFALQDELRESSADKAPSFRRHSSRPVVAMTATAGRGGSHLP
jgi:Glycosyltransferase family 87